MKTLIIELFLEILCGAPNRWSPRIATTTPDERAGGRVHKPSC